MHRAFCAILFFLLLLTGESMKAQTLQYFLNAARENNPAVQENRNLAAIAGLESEKAKAAYRMPEISATGNLLYAPVIKGVGYENAVTNGALYSTQLNANLPLFTRQQVGAYEKSSLVNQQIYHRQTALSQHDLARQVTEQFILTWQNLQRITTTRQLLDFLSEQEKLVRVFAENAILSQSDVLFFTIEKENQQLALRDLQVAYRLGLANLNLLCGLTDTSYVELQAPRIDLKADTADLSNFLEIYRLDSLLAAGNQEISELKYRPQLTAFANTGLNAIMFKTIFKKFGFSAGLNFSVTLFDGHQRDLTRQQTRLNQETNRVNRNFQANQVQQHRLLARQQIDLLDSKIQAARQQVSDYETLLKFYRERIARGELSVNDYMNTFKSYASLRGDFTMLSTSRLLLINEYNYWNW